MEHEFRLLGGQGVRSQLPFPLPTVKRGPLLIWAFPPSLAHATCSRTLSRLYCSRGVSLPFWPVNFLRVETMCRVP